MTSGDDPAAAGNRTVFRPSPLSGLGQPRPAAPPPPAAPPASDYAPPAASPPGQAAPAPAYAPPPPAPVRPSGPRLSDEGIPVPPTPRESRAPMVTEAGPVLALAASVRSGRARIGMREFQTEASTALVSYDRAIAPHYPDETRRVARALLAATIDDIARNLPSLDGAAPWTGPSLAGELDGAPDEERIWGEVDKALKEPEDNADILELAHACIAAGFQGKYRTAANGRAELSDLTTRLYGGLDHIKALSMRYVSPNWVGYDAPLGKVGLFSIVALVIAGALVLILAVYAVLRVTGGGGDEATQVAFDARSAILASTPAEGVAA